MTFTKNQKQNEMNATSKWIRFIVASKGKDTDGRRIAQYREGEIRLSIEEQNRRRIFNSEIDSLLVHFVIILITDIVQYGTILDIDVPRLHVYRLEICNHVYSSSPVNNKMVTYARYLRVLRSAWTWHISRKVSRLLIIPSYCSLARRLQRANIDTNKSSSNSRLFLSCSITSTAKDTKKASSFLNYSNYSVYVLF